MRILSMFLVVVAVAQSKCGAGTIVGTVIAQGPKVPTEATGGGAYGSRRYKYVEKLDYASLRDFVVNVVDYVVPVNGALDTKIVQRDATFEPHVLPIVVGTRVRWPNEDDIFHNVFSMTETQDFNLGFYKKEKVPEVRFDKPGRVDVFCALHTNMHCVILVLPNPYFALTDAKSSYVIKDVPPGKYRLRAWHERVPSQTKDVVVPANGVVRVDFSPGVAELQKP